MTSEYAIEPLANYHCACGENPLWDDRRSEAFWEDIPTGRLFRLDPATGKHRCFHQSDGPVGGFTFQEDGNLLLFGPNRITRLGDDGRETLVAEGIDDGMTRFNDVIADPAGRVFAGTMGRTNQSGGLYRVDTDGAVTRLFTGTGCSNGMGFTPDQRQMYWTCSTTRRIFRFDYDADTGGLSNRQLFLELPADEHIPDGMTVDADGNVWSARWDGAGLFKYSPAGDLLEKIDLPVAKVSSVVFGGEALDALYVTTAGGHLGADTPDGTLYRVKVPAHGLLEFRSAIRNSE